MKPKIIGVDRGLRDTTVNFRSLAAAVLTLRNDWEVPEAFFETARVVDAMIEEGVFKDAPGHVAEIESGLENILEYARSAEAARAYEEEIGIAAFDSAAFRDFLDKGDEAAVEWLEEAAAVLATHANT